MHVTRKQWDRDSYYRLAETGALDGERVELVEGEILTLSPQNRAHSFTTGILTNLLVGLFGRTHIVRSQMPLNLSRLSQPEPDFALVTHEVHRQQSPHPSCADLVIEVSDSSLAYDRDIKAHLYAQAGIPEYWIVNLVGRQIEVFRQPAPDSLAPFGHRYGQQSTHSSGRVSPLFAPGDVDVGILFLDEP